MDTFNFLEKAPTNRRPAGRSASHHTRRATVRIGGRVVGEGEPVYTIGEIGINHNGSLDIAKKLIDAAKDAGLDSVKFQKREPEVCVPRDQWEKMRDTPWGRMSYIDYKRRMEFGQAEFDEIDRYCKSLGIQWFASCWDVPSVEFMTRYEMCAHKIASACLTDNDLLLAVRRTGLPVIASTGMSTPLEIAAGVESLGREQLCIAHSTSTYPCPVEELNLRMISTLKREYPDHPIGYSGHESGLAPSIAAVAIGATFVERHITLDRTMWGTDQSASLEPDELKTLVTEVRTLEKAFGDGIKRVYQSEVPIRAKLRRVQS